MGSGLGVGCGSEPELIRTPADEARLEQELATPDVAGALTGTGSVWVSSVATHPDLSITVVGTLQGTADVDVRTGTYPLTTAGEGDVFVAHYDSSLNLKWAFRLGSTRWDEGYDVALDSNGNVFITGYFQGTVDFNPSSATYAMTTFGDQEAFLAAYSTTGKFLWARQLRSSFVSYGTTVNVDATGNIIWGGGFYNDVDVDLGSVLGCYKSTGGLLSWVHGLGDTQDDTAMDVSTHPAFDRLTVGGSFQGSVDFDPSASSFVLSATGTSEMYAAQYDFSGSFVHAIASSGSGTAETRGVSLDGSGASVLVGAFNGTKLMPPMTLSSTGTAGFIVRRKP